MLWLNSVSMLIALMARVVTVGSVAMSWRRLRAARLGWQAWLLPVLMLGAAGFFQLADGFAGAAHVLLGLSGQLLLLAAACLIWPLLRQFGTEALQHSTAQAQSQSRLELAKADASESRHWMRLAEKIARVGHWRYSVADQCLTWSDEVFTIFGLEPGGLQPALDLFVRLIAPEDRARARADFAQALETACPFEFTVRTLHAGHVTARGIPEVDDAGKVTALFGVLVDITNQKRVEDELKNAHEASEIANRELDALARHDALTGLPNRRHFDESIAMEFRRTAREMQPMGLIMIDLDYFKLYNDHYGHPMGDDCLRMVAGAIASVPQRPADLVARYGGEEIVVLLPNTDLAGTETVADLIVQAVRAMDIPHAGNPEGVVTVSCGAASFEPTKDPYLVVKLVERADQALYAAKRAGRNRASSQAIAA